jgi:hypothetical protein
MADGAVQAAALALFPLRFAFLAQDGIRFPPGRAANILRGALGTVLSASPAYSRIFAPRAPAGSAPSGLLDPPRPFVFRVTHLDGAALAPGAPFYVDLNYFDLRHPESISELTAAFAGLGSEGFGPGRGRASLVRVEQRDAGGQSRPLGDPPLPLVLSLEPPDRPVSRVTVAFRTPTELKSGDHLAPRPEFSILAARIRDRLSALGEWYGAGPLSIDFRGFGERARSVALTRCELSATRTRRRSSRTGQIHPLGGFTGEADYEGDLTGFLPYLGAAAWTGVGRQTVWGKGEIAVTV